MKTTTTLATAIAALLLGGCAATSYHLTLMPRDSGKLYYGTADGGASSEGPIAVTIEDKTYTGTWVQVTPDRSYGYVSGGFGYGAGGRGRWGGWSGGGGFVTMDNPEGGVSSALLQAKDGTGLRCEFRGDGWGRGGGKCRDDRGLEYDVQVRPKAAG